MGDYITVDTYAPSVLVQPSVDGSPVSVTVNIPVRNVSIATVGIQGPPGSGGGGGSGTFVWQQMSASELWTIAHNLGDWPSVTVVTSAGQTVEGDVTYVNDDVIQVKFSAPFGGTAYLN